MTLQYQTLVDGSKDDWLQDAVDKHCRGRRVVATYQCYVFAQNQSAFVDHQNSMVPNVLKQKLWLTNQKFYPPQSQTPVERAHQELIAEQLTLSNEAINQKHGPAKYRKTTCQ